MFSKLLNGILGSKNEKNTKLEEKISRMDIQTMRLYVNGKLNEFEVDESGLYQIVKKLTKANEETSKHFMKIDDMDSKKKKVFDLIILILENKKTSIVVLENIQVFLVVYDEIIKKFDKDNKQIYETRIRDLIISAIERINIETNMINVMEMTK